MVTAVLARFCCVCFCDEMAIVVSLRETSGTSRPTSGPPAGKQKAQSPLVNPAPTRPQTAAILDGSPSGCSLAPMDAGPVQDWTGTRCCCCAESEDHHGRHLRFETAAEIITLFGTRQLGFAMLSGFGDDVRPRIPPSGGDRVTPSPRNSFRDELS